jgi:hypothetical protein
VIPIRDNIPSRTTPFVNYSIVAACALVFLAEVSTPDGGGRITERYGMIPVRVMHPEQPVQVPEYRQVQTNRGIRVEKTMHEAAEPAVPAWLTPLTCIFLHGGWLHIIGNMWFLYIFGDNVEDRFGHIGYLTFYLACGVLASLSHLLSDPASSLPTIGASGAIAGIMGAYLVLYPHAKVLTIIPIFFILQMAVLPASLFLGVWFLFQLLESTVGASTGVAWWAHIGGFAIGALVVFVLGRLHLLRPPVTRTLPNAERTSVYRMRRDQHPWMR